MTESLNYYSCPECEEDVPTRLPLAKYVTCPGCKSKLEIHPDADFENGMWHDLTTLSVVDPEREHIKRMLKHAKRMEEDNGNQA
jgi:DNA-directed RNA polymerase subunit RPC12/RpoP